MSLQVQQAGVVSVPVDLGRRHYQHLGVTVGGPMDIHAYMWANRLLDNAPSCAQLELCYGHFAAKFSESTMIALAGADLSATLNGAALPIWRSTAVQSGDVLKLGAPRSGLYAYLAVAGGFQIKSQLGSVCAVARDGLGGLHQDGKPLQNDDVVAYQPLERGQTSKSVPSQFIADYTQPLSIDLQCGYQFKQFAKVQQQRVFKDTYTVTKRINRQGIFLEAPKEIKYAGESLISEGIAFGAVQVPPDGHPIVLMRDGQSIGGYPKLGCITALGAGKLAQAAPGTSLHFSRVSIEDSQREYRQFMHFFNPA